MNQDTHYIASYAKVSIEEALKIQNTINNENLIDWSEASKAKTNRIIKLAQALIANGNSWENLNVPMAWVL